MSYKRFLMIPAVAFTLGLATPAFADCANDIELVNTALGTANIIDTDRATVEAAKAAAEEKLKAGDENGCQAELTLAKTVLQIN